MSNENNSPWRCTAIEAKQALSLNRHGVSVVGLSPEEISTALHVLSQDEPLEAWLEICGDIDINPNFLGALFSNILFVNLR